MDDFATDLGYRAPYGTGIDTAETCDAWDQPDSFGNNHPGCADLFLWRFAFRRLTPAGHIIKNGKADEYRWNKQQSLYQ